METSQKRLKALFSEMKTWGEEQLEISWKIFTHVVVKLNEMTLCLWLFT